MQLNSFIAAETGKPTDICPQKYNENSRIC